MDKSRPPITTTLSFFAAQARGFPHLAGQPVRLYRQDDGSYEVCANNGTSLGSVFHPRQLRGPRIPNFAKAIAKPTSLVERHYGDVLAWRKHTGWVG